VDPDDVKDVDAVGQRLDAEIVCPLQTVRRGISEV
jgi:hypothetical protein